MSGYRFAAEKESACELRNGGRLVADSVPAGTRGHLHGSPAEVHPDWAADVGGYGGWAARLLVMWRSVTRCWRGSTALCVGPGLGPTCFACWPRARSTPEALRSCCGHRGQGARALLQATRWLRAAGGSRTRTRTDSSILRVDRRRTTGNGVMSWNFTLCRCDRLHSTHGGGADTGCGRGATPH